MPDELVFQTLEIELEPGPVKFSAAAQRHAINRHRNDLPIIIPHLAQLITDPTYMGDDHRNAGKIEFVSRIQGHPDAALIALNLERGETDGSYHVCSAYFIGQSELDKKRHKGVLKVVKRRD
mgnify:FL=1